VDHSFFGSLLSPSLLFSTLASIVGHIAWTRSSRAARDDTGADTERQTTARPDGTNAVCCERDGVNRNRNRNHRGHGPHTPLPCCPFPHMHTNTNMHARSDTHEERTLEHSQGWNGISVTRMEYLKDVASCHSSPLVRAPFHRCRGRTVRACSQKTNHRSEREDHPCHVGSKVPQTNIVRNGENRRATKKKTWLLKGANKTEAITSKMRLYQGGTRSQYQGRNETSSGFVPITQSTQELAHHLLVPSLFAFPPQDSHATRKCRYFWRMHGN
jgi:hypothetical protein